MIPRAIPCALCSSESEHEIDIRQSVSRPSIIVNLTTKEWPISLFGSARPVLPLPSSLSSARALSLHTLVSIIFSVSPRDLTDSLYEYVAVARETRANLIKTFAAVHRGEQKSACCAEARGIGFSVGSAGRDDATAVADSLNARYMRARIARATRGSRSPAHVNGQLSAVYLESLRASGNSEEGMSKISNLIRCSQPVETHSPRVCNRNRSTLRD